MTNLGKDLAKKRIGTKFFNEEKTSSQAAGQNTIPNELLDLQGDLDNDLDLYMKDIMHYFKDKNTQLKKTYFSVSKSSVEDLGSRKDGIEKGIPCLEKSIIAMCEQITDILLTQFIQNPKSDLLNDALIESIIKFEKNVCNGDAITPLFLKDLKMNLDKFAQRDSNNRFAELSKKVVEDAHELVCLKALLDKINEELPMRKKYEPALSSLQDYEEKHVSFFNQTSEKIYLMDSIDDVLSIRQMAQNFHDWTAIPNLKSSLQSTINKIDQFIANYSQQNGQPQEGNGL